MMGLMRADSVRGAAAAEYSSSLVADLRRILSFTGTAFAVRNLESVTYQITVQSDGIRI
jgi:hypothetical protein